MLKVEHSMSTQKEAERANNDTVKGENGYENTKQIIVKTYDDGITSVVRVVEVKIPVDSAEYEGEHNDETKIFLTENASWYLGKGWFRLTKFGKWVAVEDFKGVLDSFILKELLQTLDIDFIDFDRSYIFCKVKEGFETKGDE